MLGKETEGWMPSGVTIASGNGDGIQVILLNNGKRLIVDFTPTESLDRTIEGPILKQYESALAKDEDEDEYEKEEAFNEVQTLAPKSGAPTFARPAPPVAAGSSLPDLHSVLYPETFFFHFNTVKGKVDVVPHEDTWDFDEPPPFDLDITNELALPTFSSSDIKVLGRFWGRHCQGPGRRKGNVLQVPRSFPLASTRKRILVSPNDSTISAILIHQSPETHRSCLAHRNRKTRWDLGR
jgi:hypothetical protein